MKRHWTAVLALLLLTLPCAQVQLAFGQRMARNFYQGTPNAGPAMDAAADTYVEELPPETQPTVQMPMSGGFEPNAHYAGPPVAYGYGGCDGQCQTCDSTYPGHCCENLWVGAPAGQFFVNVDYLLVRSTFSEALAFLRVDTSQTNEVVREANQIEFDYESSFRIGGGYRSCGCGDEFRFLYTRLQSSGDTEVAVSADVFVPYEPGMPPGGTNVIDADVDINSFDIECAKTLPLGGECACCDPCSGCCPPRCPVWDISWSGGVRIADVNWERSYVALDQAGDVFGDAEVEMDFQGAGPKIGLEGRRYFGHNGWFSVFLKGDISLLLGEFELESVRTANNGVVTTQTTECTNLIPVTELEVGATGQVTCSSRISAGYLFSAWHDLGFRDQFALAQEFPVSYDDANILGFDGFFARFEWAY